MGRICKWRLGLPGFVLRGNAKRKKEGPSRTGCLKHLWLPRLWSSLAFLGFLPWFFLLYLVLLLLLLLLLLLGVVALPRLAGLCRPRALDTPWTWYKILRKRIASGL